MAPDYPRAALAAFALVVAVALLYAGTVSGSAFGAFNPAWDGTAEIRGMADDTANGSEIVRNASAYPAEGNGTVAVVLSPSSPYTEREAAAVSRFVRSGGTVLVAADVGTEGNRLLADLGADARFDGRLVRDERRHAGAPVMPRATNVTAHRYTRGPDSLALNYGTVVRTNGSDGGFESPNGTNGTVLARTSPYAYLDSNRNDRLDDAETLAVRPVATVEPVGDGRVVAVSDPSLFINEMLDAGDNRAFARALLYSHDRVLLDVSHAGDVPPLTGLVLALRESAVAQLLLGAAGVALLVGRGTVARALGRRRGGERPVPSVSGDAARAALEARHPEWDDERVRRVTEAVMPGALELADDE